MNANRIKIINIVMVVIALIVLIIFIFIKEFAYKINYC